MYFVIFATNCNIQVEIEYYFWNNTSYNIIFSQVGYPKIKIVSIIGCVESCVKMYFRSCVLDLFILKDIMETDTRERSSFHIKLTFLETLHPTIHRS